MPQTYLERYLAGEYRAVWDELTALGQAVRQHKYIFEALAVARETMRRVRFNTERLVERLQTLGYQFEGIPYQPPTAETLDQLELFEENIGLLPLSLRALYETVGEIDLRESFTRKSRTILTVEKLVKGLSWAYSDALVVFPVAAAIEEYHEWQSFVEVDGPEEAGPFQVPIAPDALHKANVSGGAPYGIKMPNEGMDGLLLEGDEEEWHHTTFVNYLRICFKWGGFPGWERFQGHPSFPATQLAFLTEGLLDF